MNSSREFQMSLLKSTLRLLADGKFHSDKEISNLLGIPHKLIPKVLEKLLDPSINVEVVNDKNYRISGGLELLDASYIVNELGETNQLLSQLEVLSVIDSTNNYLLNKLENTGNYAVLAEQQTAGRGQFNRTWYSNFGKNIALSLLWRFSIPLSKLNGLTLVVGIAVVRALEEYGLRRIQLKWPNDIIYEEKKLAGILIESRSIEERVQRIIIGMGLNLYNPSANHLLINHRAITSIFSIQNSPPRRNHLAVLILKNLLHSLTVFETNGLDHFMRDWQRLDSLIGKFITIQNQTNFLEGMGRGINTQGQLGVQIKDQIHYFNSGEIRVKLKTND